MATTQQKNPASVWELIRSAHTAMIVGGAVAFVGAGLKVVPYIALVEIGRGFLTGTSAAHQWGWFAAAVVAMVIHGVAYTGALGATHLAEASLRNELRLKLVNKLPRLPLGWFNDRSSGQINRAVISDTEQIHTLVAHLAGDMMNSAGTIVVGFGYLLWLDARFAGLLILAWLLVMGLSMLPGMMGMRQSFDEYSAAQQERATVTVEMVDGIKEVKNFGMTADVFGRFDAAARKSADVTMNWMRKSGISVAIMGAVMQPAATLALTIGLGFWFVQLGWVTPITVVAFALGWVGIPGGPEDPRAPGPHGPGVPDRRPVADRDRRRHLRLRAGQSGHQGCDADLPAGHRDRAGRSVRWRQIHSREADSPVLGRRIRRDPDRRRRHPGADRQAADGVYGAGLPGRHDRSRHHRPEHRPRQTRCHT